MNTRVLFFALLISGAIISRLSCYPEEDTENPHKPFFTITVFPDLEMTVTPPVFFIADIECPGVSAERISKQVDIIPASVSQNGTTVEVSFSVVNRSPRAFSCLWLVVKKVDPWVELASVPDAINRNEEPIFVFGPLDPESRFTIELEFYAGEFKKNYTFQFDILSISPRLALTANPDDPREELLFSVDYSGKDLFRITKGFRRNIDAAWAPGNELLAFTSWEDNGTFQIYTIHPDGSHLHLVTGDPAHSEHSAFWPSFSPDGKHLVYSCENRSPGSSQDICINSVLGDGETVIASGQGWYQDRIFRPSWSPDGTKILYSARHPVKDARYYLFVQEIDPKTLELQGSTVQEPVNEVYDGDTLNTPDSSRCLLPSGIHWAPDSRQVTLVAAFFECQWIESEGKCKWVRTFKGLVILDLARMIEDGPRVYPGPYATLFTDFDPNTEDFKGPSFSPQADRLTYGHDFPDGSNTIVHVLLDPDYQPISLDEYMFLEMECDIMTPNWPPPLLPGFYR
jgi:hypothetical protein